MKKDVNPLDQGGPILEELEQLVRQGWQRRFEEMTDKFVQEINEEMEEIRQQIADSKRRLLWKRIAVLVCVLLAVITFFIARI